MRALRALALSTAVATAAGCVSTSRLIESHPLDQPGAPRGVAVIASPEAPATRLQAFARGESEGASKGALGGAATGAYVVLLLAGPAIVFFPAVLGAGAVIGMAAGTAAGTTAAVPEERAAAIEQLAADAVGRLRLPELTAAAVAGSVKKFAERDAATFDRSAGKDPAAYRLLRQQGFGAAIEVRMKEIGFRAAGASSDLSLFLTAEARLVDTATGKPVALRGLLYVSAQHAHALWTQDDAALTTAEIERACGTLAERMVDSLLLNPGVARQGTVTGRDACGLAPVSPELRWGSDGPAESGVESVTPMLAWQKVPAEPWSSDYRAWNPNERPAGSTPWGGAGQGSITYDLRIWSVVDGAPAALVYERLKLPEPQHRVEVPLEPGSTYFWSVRMRYVVDGRLLAAPWSRTAGPGILIEKPLLDALVYARLDDGTVRPAACGVCDCLDFIPAPNHFRFTTP